MKNFVRKYYVSFIAGWGSAGSVSAQFNAIDSAVFTAGMMAFKHL